MTPDPLDILESLSKWVTSQTVEGRVHAHDIYVALRSVTLTLEKTIEQESGSATLATLQQVAFDVSARIHPVRVVGP